MYSKRSRIYLNEEKEEVIHDLRCLCLKLLAMEWTLSMQPSDPIILNRTQLQSAMYTLVTEASYLEFPLIVKNSVQNPNGKWPKAVGNAICMRIDYFNQILVDNIKQAWKNFMETIDQDYGIVVS